MENSEIITLITEIAKQREKIDKLQKIVDYLRKQKGEKERTDGCI